MNEDTLKVEPIKIRPQTVLYLAIAKVFFPHIFYADFAKMHLEWIDSFDYSRVGIQAPPFFGKSKIFSFLLPIISALGLDQLASQILEEAKISEIKTDTLPDRLKKGKKDLVPKQIFLASNTGDVASDFLGEIKAEFENNELLIETFGDQTTGKWTQDEIGLANKSKILSKGRDYQFRRFHPDLMILDDVQTDENQTKEQFLKDRTWFSRTILSRIKSQQQLFVIANRIHDLSIIADIVDKKDSHYANWHVNTYTAVNQQGLSQWKAFWSQEEIDMKKVEMKGIFFIKEFMNDPSAGSDREAIKYWMQTYEELPACECLVIMTVDPAFTSDPYKISSSTGITILYIPKSGHLKGKILLRYIEKQKLTVGGIVDWLVSLHKIHRCDFIGFEDVAAQKILKDLFIAMCEKLIIHLPSLLDLPATKSKEARLKDVIDLVKNGTVLFHKNSKGELTHLDFIETELLISGFELADRLDSFVHGLSIAQELLKGLEWTDERTGQELTAEPIFDEVTGFVTGVKEKKIVRSNTYTEEESEDGR